MGPTGAEGPRVPDEPVPTPAATGPAADDGLESFLDVVRAVQREGDAPAVSTAHDEPRSRKARRAERRAADDLRAHEQKLAKAERRNARRRRGPVEPTTAPLDDPPDEELAGGTILAGQSIAGPVVPPEAEPAPASPPEVSTVLDPAPVSAAQTSAIAVEPVHRVPAQNDEPDLSAVDPETAAQRAEVATSRKLRRRERRNEVARAIAITVPAEEGDGTGPAEAAAPVLVAQGAPALSPATGEPDTGPPGSGDDDRHEEQGRRARRRDRRREKALAKAVARAAAKGQSRERPPEPETLAEYVARVDAAVLPRRSRRSRPRTPRVLRRTAKVVAVVAVVGACVALPWTQPAVPDWFASLVPDRSAPAPRVEDPPVSPSTEGFTGPVGVAEQGGPLAGVRLQSAGQPREIEVARLHVDSEVVPISGQSGSLLPPSDPQVLGWWREGRWPGAGRGSAVITGHTVHTGGGALDHLDKLVVGDSLRVRTDNGWIRYVVQRARIYSTEELAREADSIFRLGGVGRLVLITCDDWNGEFYESNAVVFAAPATDEPSVS